MKINYRAATAPARRLQTARDTQTLIPTSERRSEAMAAAQAYKFSFGPWNISEGGDPFGPNVRPSLAWSQKLPVFKRLGFDAVMFHDDDIVPQIEEKTPDQIDR